MSDKNLIQFSRRKTLKLTGATMFGAAGLSSLASGEQSETPGRFIAGSLGQPISKKQIRDLRASFLKKEDGIEEVIFSQKMAGDNESLYGYAVYTREEDGEKIPVEYLEALPDAMPKQTRRAIIDGIRERVRALANGTETEDHYLNNSYTITPTHEPRKSGNVSIATPSGGDNVSYDTPEWENVGEIHRAKYVTYSGNGDTVGRIDWDYTVVRNSAWDDPDGQEMGCANELEMWPGRYLVDYDSSVGNNEKVWSNTEAYTEQDWTSGNMGPYELHDSSPIGSQQRDWDGSATIGVDSKMVVNASITLAPNGVEIEYNEQSDPGDTVETQWNFPGTWGDDSRDDHVVIGNLGVAICDHAGPGNETLMWAGVTGTFEATECLRNGCYPITESGSLTEQVQISELV